MSPLSTTCWLCTNIDFRINILPIRNRLFIAHLQVFRVCLRIDPIVNKLLMQMLSKHQLSVNKTYDITSYNTTFLLSSSIDTVEREKKKRDKSWARKNNSWIVQVNFCNIKIHFVRCFYNIAVPQTFAQNVTLHLQMVVLRWFMFSVS